MADGVLHTPSASAVGLMKEPEQDIARIGVEAREWLAYLNSDDVTAEGSRRFAAWLRASERHAQAYRRVASLWDGMAQLSDLAELEPLDRPSPGERFHAAVRRARRAFSDAVLERALPIAAGTVAALLLLLAFNLYPNLVRPPAPQQYATAVGQIRDVRLPDGSTVTVGARSRIEVSFAHRERRVTLVEGEAFFSVRKNAARPFSVVAGDTLVRVTGTTFEVSREPGKVFAAVLEGVVEITRSEGAGEAPAANAVGETHVVTAGQRVVSDAAGVRQTKGAAPGAWRKGHLVYVDASLDEVIADANRYSDQTIVFGATDLANLRVTAAFRTDQIDLMLASLAKTYPIDMEPTEDGRIILKPRHG